MNLTKISFHTERKRICCILALFILVTLILNIVIAIATFRNQAQLKTLNSSDYLYSVEMKKAADCDAYYQFDAGIGFSLNSSVNSVLNAEVFMQLPETEYTDQIFWNAEKLSQYGVAISEMMAKRNNLNLGDIVYSKHIVDGSIKEYSIEQIIPEVMCVRNIGRSYSDGIIIIGFDKLYAENVRYSVVVFTKEPIEVLSDRYNEVPEGIVYREDEIEVVVKELLPYYIVQVLISLMAVICLTYILVKEISCNFKRLMILGCRKTELDRAYHQYIFGVGMGTILVSHIITMFILLCMNILENVIVVMIGILLIESVMLLVIERIAKSKLWRN